MESLIGPEIYSNPVQHVRIKPPEHILPKNQFGNPILGETIWHQDQGVVVPEADETNMLTVWFAFEDVDIEQGPLKVVPGSHKHGLLTHWSIVLWKWLQNSGAGGKYPNRYLKPNT